MNKTRLLALLTAFFLLLGMISPQAGAFPPAVHPLSVRAESMTGQQGDLTWILYDDGELAVSGTGELGYLDVMEDYGYQIKKLVVCDGITSIGYMAFHNCTSLQSVDLAASVKSVGSMAFCVLKNARTQYFSTSIAAEDGLYLSDNSYPLVGSLDSVTIRNPECRIGSDAFANGYSSGQAFVNVLDSDGSIRETYHIIYPYFSGTITGYAGSTAQAYAQSHGITFKSLGEAPEEPTQEPTQPSTQESTQPSTQEPTQVPTQEPTQPSTEAASVILSGTVGTNVSWELDAAGTLTVHGTGRCEGWLYDGLADADAKMLRNRTKKIVVGDGITYFPGFHGENLREVVLGDTVEELGYLAFDDCPALSEVTVPDALCRVGLDPFRDTAWQNAQPYGVIYAGHVAVGYKGTMSSTLTLREGTLAVADCAFEPADSKGNLTSVVLPEGLTHIGDRAFTWCENLRSITIPDSVYAIGEDAFQGTAWMNAQPDGLVYAGRVAYRLQGDTPSQITLRSDTTGIAGGCFRAGNYDYGNDLLKSVTIPEGVRSVGSGAFYGCKGLTAVTMPDTVAEIGRQAFAYCTALTQVNIPASLREMPGTPEYAWDDPYSYGGIFRNTAIRILDIPENITYIGSSTFGSWGCTPDHVIIRNPDCVFHPYNGGDGSTIVYGHRGSTAQALCEENGLTFYALEDLKTLPLGDPNDDGRINANDASAVLIAAARVGAKRPSGMTLTQETAADVSGDGRFNANDAALILRYAAYVGAKGMRDLETYLGR